MRGLSREDLFTVVFDQVMTDTARYADIVLPATTFLEHYDISRGYGAYYRAAGEARHRRRRGIATQRRGVRAPLVPPRPDRTRKRRTKERPSR